jgi:hypothetical protein
MQNNFKLSIDQINKNGCYAKKVFRHCTDLQDFIQTIEFLSQKNRNRIVQYQDIQMPKNGYIVLLRTTLMQWGEIGIIEYSRKRYNNFIRNGYELI